MQTWTRAIEEECCMSRSVTVKDHTQGSRKQWTGIRWFHLNIHTCINDENVAEDYADEEWNRTRSNESVSIRLIFPTSISSVVMIKEESFTDTCTDRISLQRNFVLDECLYLIVVWGQKDSRQASFSLSLFLFWLENMLIIFSDESIGMLCPCQSLFDTQCAPIECRNEFSDETDAFVSYLSRRKL